MIRRRWLLTSYEGRICLKEEVTWDWRWGSGRWKSVRSFTAEAGAQRWDSPPAMDSSSMDSSLATDDRGPELRWRLPLKILGGKSLLFSRAGTSAFERGPWSPGSWQCPAGSCLCVGVGPCSLWCPVALVQLQIPQAQNSSGKVLLRTADKGSDGPKPHQDIGEGTFRQEPRFKTRGGHGRNISASTAVTKCSGRIHC